MHRRPAEQQAHQGPQLQSVRRQRGQDDVHTPVDFDERLRGVRR